MKETRTTTALLTLMPPDWEIGPDLLAVLRVIGDKLQEGSDRIKEDLKEFSPYTAERTKARWINVFQIADVADEESAMGAVKYHYGNYGYHTLLYVQYRIRQMFPRIVLREASPYSFDPTYRGPSRYRILGTVNSVEELTKLISKLRYIMPAHMVPVFEVDIDDSDGNARAGVARAGIARAGNAGQV